MSARWLNAVENVLMWLTLLSGPSLFVVGWITASPMLLFLSAPTTLALGALTATIIKPVTAR